MHWTAVEPGPGVTNWSGDRRVGIYASPDNWRTCYTSGADLPIGGPGGRLPLRAWLCALVRICLYCLKCTQFGQLILERVIEIVATRCQILRPKCTKFDFRWSSAPDCAGELTALPQAP